jgi:hypothetical protein
VCVARVRGLKGEESLTLQVVVVQVQRAEGLQHAQGAGDGRPHSVVAQHQPRQQAQVAQRVWDGARQSIAVQGAGEEVSEWVWTGGVGVWSI